MERQKRGENGGPATATFDSEFAMSTNEKIDQLAINTIRFLAADAVQKANSGHPGAPMGAAAVAYILWDRYLRHNPRNPAWFNRDRFILSAGHASTLLYSLLHLTGYDLSLDDLRNFRQWDSITPGHPEYGRTPGVEVTTGPLGQGFANGVGMAMAERFLAAKFNRPGYKLIDHRIYALVSDGDLQEGVSYEAASLAGHLRLGNLIYLYDDNRIQIEGSTAMVFSEDVSMRFQALGWQVIGPIDGNQPEKIAAAIGSALETEDTPKLVICRTNIAYGSPKKQDTAAAHGEPLGESEVQAAKQRLGWPEEPKFYIPPEVLQHMSKAVERGRKLEQEWRNHLEAYKSAYPHEYSLFQEMLNGELPHGWDEDLNTLFERQTAPLATRTASGKILNKIAQKVANLMGGSADLGPSNKTLIENEGDFSAQDYSGRNLHFGVREHAMAAIANGLALHGGVIPYIGTFLVFSDYMRPAIRLAAMMGLRIIYIFSHDSIGLGEDGPTHQPIEQLASLRTVPNLTVIRPADANETIHAWKTAISNTKGPTALILTRQNVPVLSISTQAARGAYVVLESAGVPEAIIIATGSEVHLAREAGKMLLGEGRRIRVVSMPCREIFERQPKEYKNEVLPPAITKRVVIEAARTFGWEKYSGPEGLIIGLDHFGASAPYQVLYEKFGLTADNLAKTIRNIIEK